LVVMATAMAAVAAVVTAVVMMTTATMAVLAMVTAMTTPTEAVAAMATAMAAATAATKVVAVAAMTKTMAATATVGGTDINQLEATAEETMAAATAMTTETEMMLDREEVVAKQLLMVNPSYLIMIGSCCYTTTIVGAWH
jgi:hypothetical protein